MKTPSFFLASYLLLLLSPVSAQITFQKTFGGINNDFSSSVQQTTDGGYIIIGRTYGYGAGNDDIYLIKTDANGDSLWTKTFGGTEYEVGTCVLQTIDSGYIILGHTQSFGQGSFDIYLIKISINGNIQWSKTFGGITSDYSKSVHQTADGGYIITGITESFGAGNSDVYLIKTNANGNMLWTKTFGGTNNDVGYSVKQTTDGGYIITGVTHSFGSAHNHVYLIKTDVNGDSLWTKTIDGTSDDGGSSIQQTTDGGYIISGGTAGFGVGGSDVYLIKTDTSGNLLWTKTFGGTNNDYGFSVQQTTDGGYIIAGTTESFGAGSNDVYLIKTDANGDTLWTRTYGGSNYDYGQSVQQTTDGGYIITGYTQSYGAGFFDVYLIKTDSLGNSGCHQASTASIVTTSATQVTSPATIVSSTATIVTNPATITGSGSIITTLCTTVGIPPHSFGEGTGVRFSPNPSPGNFTITFTNAINRGEVQIFNAYGTKVFSQNIYNTSNTEIHFKNIPEGIYFVKVWNGEKYISNKIIIL